MPGSSRLVALIAILLLFQPATASADLFVRGDCNGDSVIDIGDPILILLRNFSGAGEPSCLDACDADDDGEVDGVVTDAIYLLVRLFLRGPQPPAPFPDCGFDLTEDSLTCDGPTPCPDAGTVALVRTSPSQAETGVAVTRETILEFDGPLASGIGTDAVRALFSGVPLEFRLHVSPDRKTLTLFYAEPLPASARIRVELDGTRLRSVEGEPVDLDGDGTPGDTLALVFETLSTTRFPGTHVCGRVFASELAPSPEGIVDINTPLAGVRITVDGLEDEAFAITDAMGNFRLEDAPAGRFFVHIDGRTATNPIPEGAYYPFVGKAWEAAPGIETTVGNVFLPLVDAGTLQAVSETEETVIGFPDSVLEEFPDFGDVRLTVPADSLFRDDGSRGGSVGIAPVSPDRLPGQLPPGLRFPLVITVQTDGATNFDRPAPICFPNLPDPQTGAVLPPGAKSALWSFNHDIGRFEVVGSMTVSADGRRVCSDPGVGIRAPGWHGFAPGSGGPGGRCNPSSCEQDEDEEVFIFDDEEDAGDGCGDSPTCEDDDHFESPCNDCHCPRPPAQPRREPPEPPKHQQPGALTDPVYLHSGEFYTRAVDLRIPGRGFDFVWTRTYRSRLGRFTRQGANWDFSYNVYIRRRGRMILVRDGSGREDLFYPRPDGSFGRPGLFRKIVGNTLLFQDGGRWEFHSPLLGTREAGKLHTSTDRNGNQMRFHYDARGRLIRVTDTLDRDIHLTYHPSGHLATITDFANRTVRYEYYDGSGVGGGRGDLKSVTTPVVAGTPTNNDFLEGKTTTYTYSFGLEDERLNHNLVTITDGRRNDPNDPTFGSGPYLVNFYGPTLDPDDAEFDRVVRQVWGGDIIDLHYRRHTPPTADASEIMTTIVNDRQGNVREFDHDNRNQLIEVREYTGRADPRQPTTPVSNRPRGKLRSTDRSFYRTVLSYTSSFLPRRVVYPNGNIVEFEYEEQINPGVDARFAGNLRTVRKLPGSHTPAGDQPVIEEHFEYQTSFGGCCGTSFVSRHVDGRGNETLHSYDARGNRIRTIHRDPAIVEDFEYNDFGQLTARVWPDNGSGHRRRDEYDYHDSGPQRGYLRQMTLDSENLALTYTFTHDLVGNVVGIVDPGGDETSLLVNQLNQLVRMTLPEVDDSGIRYQHDFIYDANDNIVRVDVQNVNHQLGPELNTHYSTFFEYEVLNLLIRRIEEAGQSDVVVTEYEYDGNRNLTLTRLPEATNGNQPENTVRFLWDERDLPFRRIRAEGSPDQATLQFDYDGNGNLIRTLQGIEGTPRVVEFGYDGFDRLVTRTDPMGNSTRYAHDPNSNLVSIMERGELTDTVGNANNVRLREHLRDYDSMDRLIRQDVSFFVAESQVEIGDGASTTEIEYSPNSQVLRTVNDNGHESTRAYDTLNRLREAIDHLGNVRTYGYDADSNLISLTEVDRSDLGRPDQQFRTTYSFDNLDRLVEMRDSAGNTTQYSHDSRNNVTRTIDALGNVIRHRYDGLNRLLTTTRVLTDSGTGSGNEIGTVSTTYIWDDSSRLVGLQDDNGNTTEFTFDPLDRLIATTREDGTRVFQEYDVHDNVIRTEDPNGTIVTSTYDLLDRLTRQDITPGPEVSTDTTFETFGYDGLSRMVAAVNDRSTLTWRHDSLSSVVEETLNGETTVATFDGLGNLVSLTYPGGRSIAITYDELERKKSISDSTGPIAGYSYVGPDRLERVELGNGTRMDFAYDGISGVANPAGDFGVKQVVRSTHSRISDGAVIDDRSYRWDPLNNKTRWEDLRFGGSGLVEAYEYDSIYRLVASTRSFGGVPVERIEYLLDGVGNRAEVTGSSDAGAYTMSNTEPEPADRQCNQYTSTSFDTRLYDRNGNLISTDPGLASERTFIYDYADRLVGYLDSNSNVESLYSYDPLGRRIDRVVDATSVSETQYYYAGWDVVEEQSSGGATEATYIHGIAIDDVLQMDRGGAALYYHRDEIFSVRALTDSSGAVVERYDYGDFGAVTVLDATGAPRDGSATGNPFHFTGRRHDEETGWYHYRTRFLDPRAGRFATQDPIGAWGDAANLGNAFTYSANNPATLRDPYGLQPGRPPGFREGPGEMIVRPKGDLASLRPPPPPRPRNNARGPVYKPGDMIVRPKGDLVPVRPPSSPPSGPNDFARAPTEPGPSFARAPTEPAIRQPGGPAGPTREVPAPRTPRWNPYQSPAPSVAQLLDHPPGPIPSSSLPSPADLVKGNIPEGMTVSVGFPPNSKYRKLHQRTLPVKTTFRPPSFAMRVLGVLGGEFLGSAFQVVALTTCHTIRGLQAIVRQGRGGLANVNAHRMFERINRY